MATAHVNLAALSHNLAQVRAHVPADTDVLVAVKANAYGHGSVAVAKHLESQGVSWFGVATAGEAFELRRGGVNANILIFSPVYDQMAELIEAEVALCIASEESLDALIKTGLAAQARAHLKVDTGMGRLGRSPAEALNLAERLESLGALAGVWTHFAASDEPDRDFTNIQLERFAEFRGELARASITPGLVHAANSAAVFAYPKSHFDMVRPGIAVYGYHSSPQIKMLEPNLRPALTLSAPITFIKRVRKGTPISYGTLWHAPQDRTIITVRIGYADGYPRLLTGQADVLVQGQRCPVVGRICMDQLMVDVGSLEVRVGERAVVIAADKANRLDAESLAQKIGTISYELLTSIAPRVARVYS